MNTEHIVENTFDKNYKYSKSSKLYTNLSKNKNITKTKWKIPFRYDTINVAHISVASISFIRIVCVLCTDPRHRVYIYLSTV